MDLGIGWREPYFEELCGLMKSLLHEGPAHLDFPESFSGAKGYLVLTPLIPHFSTPTVLFVCSVNPFFRAGAKVHSQLRPCWKKDKFSTSRGSRLLRFLLGIPLWGTQNRSQVGSWGVSQCFMVCLLVD